jgi:integrase
MPRIREAGEGGLFKIKGCKTWYIKVGGKRYPTGTRVKQEALAQLQEKIGQHRAGALPLTEPGKLRYEAMRDSLLAEYKTQGYSGLQTLSDETVTIWGLKHLDRFFKGRKAASITTDLLREFIEHRQKQEANPGTINRNLSLLRRMFNLARQENKVQQVPYFPLLAEGRPRQGFVEDAQFAKLLAALPARLQPLILFLYRTGCRLGEATSVDWSQVDLSAGTVRLAGDQTKSGEPRTLPLPDELIAMLKKQRPKSGPVFAVGNFRKSWISACKKAGLGTVQRGKENGGYGVYTGLIVHDLRRSAVRNFVRAGIPEVVAMKISGHKSRSVFERYNIVSTADIHRAVRAVDTGLIGTNLVQIGAGRKRSRQKS